MENKQGHIWFWCWLTTTLVALFLSVQPFSHAQTSVQTVFTGVGISNGTSVTASIPGTATTKTLTAQSNQLTISVPFGGANLYFNPFGTATTGSFMIPAGGSFTFQGLPGIKTFSVIGSSASGNFSYLAH